MKTLYHPRPERWPQVSLKGLFVLVTLLGVFLINLLPGWVYAGLPLSAGGAISVGATDLVPEVNREPGIRMALVFFTGVALFFLLRMLAPAL